MPLVRHAPSAAWAARLLALTCPAAPLFCLASSTTAFSMRVTSAGFGDWAAAGAARARNAAATPMVTRLFISSKIGGRGRGLSPPP